METKEEVTKRLNRNSLTNSSIGILSGMAYLATSQWEDPLANSLNIPAGVVSIVSFLMICIPLVSFSTYWPRMQRDRKLLQEMSGQHFYPVTFSPLAKKVLAGVVFLWIMPIFVFSIMSAQRNDAIHKKQEAELRSINIEIARKEKEIEILSAKLSQTQPRKN